MHPSLFPRLYFVSVGLLAAFVAATGLLAPHLIDHAIPWAVPPLHARVIGAFYLGGMVLMFGASRYPVQRVWAMLPLTAAWTGVLLLVSVLWIADFNWASWPVRFWWFAYVAFPLGAAWLAFRTPSGPVRPTFAPAAAAIAILAALLLLAPSLAATHWPWPLPPLLSQIYAGPLFGLALGITLVAGRDEPVEARLLAAGLFTLAAATLASSLLHLPLFAPEKPGTWFWFAALFFAIGRSGRQLISRGTRKAS